MSKTTKWSEYYGRLEFLPRAEYFRGNRWVYVASEEASIREMEPEAENVWAPSGGEPVIVKVKGGAF